jgi:hypothetical protein
LQDILERLAGEAGTLCGFYQRRKVKAEPTLGGFALGVYFAVTVTMECAMAGVREVRTCQTCKVASKQRTEYGRRQTIACSNMADVLDSQIATRPL